MEGVGLRVKNEGCRIKSGEFKRGGGLSSTILINFEMNQYK